MSIELPVTTRQCRDMTDNVESDVKPEQTNKLINKTINQIINHYCMIFQLLNSESVADHSSGVILVGDLGTGKTAIIEQLVAHSCFGDGRGGIVKGLIYLV